MTVTTSDYEHARPRGFGYFWPARLLAAWGVILLLDAWDAYRRHDVTDEDVKREFAKTR